MFPIIVYLQASLKLILKFFHIESLWAALQREALKLEAFWYLVIFHLMLFERLISNSYSCQADLRLWHVRNVWCSPKPHLRQKKTLQFSTCGGFSDFFDRTRFSSAKISHSWYHFLKEGNTIILSFIIMIDLWKYGFTLHFVAV